MIIIKNIHLLNDVQPNKFLPKFILTLDRLFYGSTTKKYTELIIYYIFQPFKFNIYWQNFAVRSRNSGQFAFQNWIFGKKIKWLIQKIAKCILNHMKPWKASNGFKGNEDKHLQKYP